MKKKQLILTNGCTASIPSVTPKNWQTGGKELLEKDWRIQFYFRDPNYKNKYPKGKQIRKKGMNEYGTLQERREATKILLDAITEQLVNHRYNPIIGEYMDKDENVDSYSFLIDSLYSYLKEKDISKDYETDIKSMIKFVEVSVLSLGLSFKPLNKISRKDIRAILKHQQKTRGISNHRFNKYKTMLSSLFDDMIEDEIIEYNPTHGIKSLSVEKKLREVMTEGERKQVYIHLKEKYYTFWRFMMIYFSSGARIRELLLLKIKSVDLSKLEYKVIIHKGDQHREVIKPINKNVAYLWKEIINEQVTDRIEINPNHFLFSRGLRKGEKSIRYEQITRRWKEHVKKKLGITADFASLTHLYADNIAAQLDLEHAQRLRSHTTDRMMKEHYAINEKQRQMDRLKNIDNPFYQDQGNKNLKVV